MENTATKNSKPKHIAIIMDGNGRWAQEHGLPRVAGHKAGVERVREIVRASTDLEIPILTLYAFSQENWKRPAEEVSVLMKLLDFFLDEEAKALKEEGVRLGILGHPEALPSSTYEKLKEVVASTRHNNRLLLNIALNYGSRSEILEAVYSLVSKARQDPSFLPTPDSLTEQEFSSRLYTQGLPDPDLLIRTSGEMRLSNFLLWQLSYSEIYITKKYWPDFLREDYVAAIAEYQRRERRFGDVLV